MTREVPRGDGFIPAFCQRLSSGGAAALWITASRGSPAAAHRYGRSGPQLPSGRATTQGRCWGCASLCPLAGKATAKDGDRDRARTIAAATTPRAGANRIPPGPLAAHRPPVNRGRSGTALLERARLPEMLPRKEPDQAPRRSQRADVPRRRRALRNLALQG